MKVLGMRIGKADGSLIISFTTKAMNGKKLRYLVTLDEDDAKQLGSAIESYLKDKKSQAERSIFDSCISLVVDRYKAVRQLIRSGDMSEAEDFWEFSTEIRQGRNIPVVLIQKMYESYCQAFDKKLSEDELRRVLINQKLKHK